MTALVLNKKAANVFLSLKAFTSWPLVRKHSLESREQNLRASSDTPPSITRLTADDNQFWPNKRGARFDRQTNKQILVVPKTQWHFVKTFLLFIHKIMIFFFHWPLASAGTRYILHLFLQIGLQQAEKYQKQQQQQNDCFLENETFNVFCCCLLVFICCCCCCFAI